MIRLFIYIYSWIVIVDALLTFVPQYKNQEWAKIVKKFAGYSVEPVRKLLPKDLPFDFSSLIVLVLLQILPSLW